MLRWLSLVALTAALSPSAWAGRVSASSELTENSGQKHGAELAFDGSLLTGWSEGVSGVGEGSWIEVRFDRPVDVESVSLWPGDLRKGERTIKEQGRPHTVTITLETDDEDEMVSEQVRIRDGAKRGIQRVDVSIEGRAKSMRITVDEAYAGYIHNNTFIAEIAVNFVKGDADAPLSRIESWKTSSTAEKASSKHREEVIGLFDTIDQSEFGDRESLYTLIGYASDGAPWLADRVKRDVPAGFRINALPPDPVAVEALLKLKDPTAIGALRMAALRTKGKQARSLLNRASYFEAFAELDAGPRRSLDTWGVSGWEKGAIRTFGEPAGVALGIYGDVYVADVANNRISVFSQAGTVRGVWGLGQPEVTSAWFSGKRQWYVAGREASTKDGGYTNPVDLHLLPGRDTEELLVLDAAGRVTWLAEDGRVLKAWKVAHETPISPGVGGEGHIMHAKGRVVVVWGNEVVVFDEEGEELDRWETEEGVPQTAEILKNGRLILGFRLEGVQYGMDGYRFGSVIGDELPEGFEAWDLASDEKGKLWVVTDNGWVLKLKRPGKVDIQVQWATWSVDTPRFAVQDGMLYILANDKISKVDALDLRAKAEMGEDAPQTLDAGF